MIPDAKDALVVCSDLKILKSALKKEKKMHLLS
jgi:hypothetical protein